MSDMDEIPPEIEEAAASAISSLLPQKSKVLLLAYFNWKATTQMSSSLWTTYSMLRTMLSVKRNIDIRRYTNLIAFLKRKSEGHKPKKSRVLRKEDFESFLKEADDDKFLLM